MTLQSDIAARLADVRKRVSDAARRSGREPGGIRIIAISKTFGVDDIRAVAGAGQMDFGENRVQEGLDKIRALADLDLSWHLVGHLQSNKARRAASSFSCIQSIDSVDLLMRMDAAAADADRSPTALVQVDLAREPTKHGAHPVEVPRIFEAAARCRAVRVTGLMTIPPFFDSPETTRPFFQQLREIRDKLLAGGTAASMLRDLSMGMSHDFDVAIEEGATMVRIGTAIFGERHV